VKKLNSSSSQVFTEVACYRQHSLFSNLLFRHKTSARGYFCWQLVAVLVFSNALSSQEIYTSSSFWLQNKN